MYFVSLSPRLQEYLSREPLVRARNQACQRRIACLRAEIDAAVEGARADSATALLRVMHAQQDELQLR